jgi:hypothetical protein
MDRGQEEESILKGTLRSRYLGELGKKRDPANRYWEGGTGARSSGITKTIPGSRTPEGQAPGSSHRNSSESSLLLLQGPMELGKTAVYSRTMHTKLIWPQWLKR